MDNRLIAAVSALLVIVGVAGCSDPGEPEIRPAGSLPAGTAEVSINGESVGKSNDVSCSTTGASTTINTGDEKSGTNSTVDSTDGMTVQFARIIDIGGFTGSYWADLGSRAKAEMNGQTYLITGSATGFHADNPSARTTDTFSIRVAC